MKLPVSFGSRLFYRVLLPGGIIAATIAILFKPVLTVGETPLTTSIIFFVITTGIGLLFLLLDRPIYMLVEGRRYWPARLWRLGIRLERRRLLNLHRVMRRCDRKRKSVNPEADQIADFDRAYHEAAAQTADFPLDPVTLMPSVAWPTRLGNTIAAYEQYSGLKYGLDSIFYWPRIWVSIDNDLRNEVDGQQALGDGAIYSAVACFFSALIVLAHELLAIIRACVPGSCGTASPLLWLAPGLLLAGYLLYRASIFAYQQFGEFFMALFDIHQNPLSDNCAPTILDQDYGLKINRLPLSDRNRAIWRYLKWHRVRRPGESRNERARKR